MGDMNMAEYRSTSKREEAANALKSLSDSIRTVDVSGYRDQVLDAVDCAKAEVDKKVDHVRSNISDHPFESVAIAAGAGILAGAAIALLSRRAVRKSM
jgi:ElaB/YqjD/DUF883 family membrane-anchored ribosome-binding protein